MAYKTEIIGGVVVHTPINQVLGPGAARLGHGVRGCPWCVGDITGGQDRGKGWGGRARARGVMENTDSAETEAAASEALWPGRLCITHRDWRL